MCSDDGEASEMYSPASACKAHLVFFGYLPPKLTSVKKKSKSKVFR